ncbi:MAG: GNAT family N-acetyltransferase [Planctomycetes bacterium]|nr:GNAT family N-acetyltransferase [Planctomycetota bacterium]
MASSRALETERLRIMPFAAAFLTEKYVGWLNDPEVVRFSEQRHRRHTMESCRDYWWSFENSPHFFWAITLRDGSAAHIGNITAHVDPPNRVADVGILIGERKVWGRNYGSEAWEAVCEYLLNDAGIRKVTAGTMADNHGMLGIMRKTGMVAEGRRLRQFLLDGREVDLVEAARFRKSA